MVSFEMHSMTCSEGKLTKVDGNGLSDGEVYNPYAS